MTSHNIEAPDASELPAAHWVEPVTALVKATYHQRAHQDRQAAGNTQIQQDSLAGVFRALRRTPPLTVEALAEVREATILEVHADPPCLVTDTPIPWDPACPLEVNGTFITLGYQADNDLFVDQVNSEWIDAKVRQTHRDKSPSQTIDRLTQYWMQYWQLPDLTHLVEDLPDLPDGSEWPQLQLPPITPTRLRQHLKSMSTYAATGPDGVSRADLLHLSDDMLQELIAVYDIAESTGTWPDAALHGLIRSLAKTTDALTPSQTRPIQVLSLTYRLYTSIRTKQILPLLAPR